MGLLHNKRENCFIIPPYFLHINAIPQFWVRSLSHLISSVEKFFRVYEILLMQNKLLWRCRTFCSPRCGLGISFRPTLINVLCCSLEFLSILFILMRYNNNTDGITKMRLVPGKPKRWLNTDDFQSFSPSSSFASFLTKSFLSCCCNQRSMNWDFSRWTKNERERERINKRHVLFACERALDD
jgi:hypothetical protein